jgi:hypothetical protein
VRARKTLLAEKSTPRAAGAAPAHLSLACGICVRTRATRPLTWRWRVLRWGPGCGPGTAAGAQRLRRGCRPRIRPRRAGEEGCPTNPTSCMQPALRLSRRAAGGAAHGAVRDAAERRPPSHSNWPALRHRLSAFMDWWPLYRDDCSAEPAGRGDPGGGNRRVAPVPGSHGNITVLEVSRK